MFDPARGDCPWPDDQGVKKSKKNESGSLPGRRVEARDVAADPSLWFDPRETPAPVTAFSFPRLIIGSDGGSHAEAPRQGG